LWLTQAFAATNYVWQDSPSPTPPYSSWETAAHVIQDAVDAAGDGDTVLVTNGVYRTGGRAVSGVDYTNRVAVDKPLTLLGVNGPEVTIIEGYQVLANVGGIGDGAVRCVFLADGASLSGFTLTSGAADIGGGILCESTTAYLTDCILTNNSAFGGGGAYSGTLKDCVLKANSALTGAGAVGSTLIGCEITENSATLAAEHGFGWGGGVWQCTLYNCTLTENRTVAVGGGAFESTLKNCTMTGNSASRGGGAYDSTLENCLLSGNSAREAGGGASSSTLNDCILRGNAALAGGGVSESVLYNCEISNSLAGFFGEGKGGGAFRSTLYSCVVVSNVSRQSIEGSSQGGGAYDCALYNSILIGNSALGDFFGGTGGGAVYSALYDCTVTANWAGYGGGVANSTLTNCVVTSNGANRWGGGALGGTLESCTLIGNSVQNETYGIGGGTHGSILNNCTVAGNSATRQHGGLSETAATNCIVYYNAAPDAPNYDTFSTLNYTCTYPMPTNGVGNITNAPLFVDTNNWADLRLLPNSPCIDAGNNDFVAWDTDLDGNPRILNGIVDMGAYEFVPLTPPELLLQLAEMVANSDLRNKRPLLASLQAALASIERGSHYSAMGQLGAFQNKVAAQVYRTDPDLAVELIEGAQRVMDALNDNP